MKKHLLFILVSVASSLLGQVNVSSSLSACYDLNGNVNDPVNSLNGTAFSVTPAVNRFNAGSTAFAFGGSTLSYIELPNDPLLKPTNAVSFSGWIRISSLNNVQFIVFTKNAATSIYGAYDL